MPSDASSNREPILDTPPPHPQAGPIVATIVPMPLVILDPALSLAAKIAAFAGPTAVHMVIGNFIEPLVFGSSMELHPVTVLLALAMWYSLWGIAGAILAVPITAVLRIVMESMNHPYARVIIAVLEGRISAALEETNVVLEATLNRDGDDDGESGAPGGGGAHSGSGTPHRDLSLSMEADALIAAVEGTSVGSAPQPPPSRTAATNAAAQAQAGAALAQEQTFAAGGAGAKRPAAFTRVAAFATGSRRSVDRDEALGLLSDHGSDHSDSSSGAELGHASAPSPLRGNDSVVMGGGSGAGGGGARGGPAQPGGTAAGAPRDPSNGNRPRGAAGLGLI